MLHNKMSVGWAASRDHVKVSDALRTTSEQQHTPHSQKHAKDSTILKVLGDINLLPCGTTSEFGRKTLINTY